MVDLSVSFMLPSDTRKPFGNRYKVDIIETHLVNIKTSIVAVITPAYLYNQFTQEFGHLRDWESDLLRRYCTPEQFCDGLFIFFSKITTHW